MERSKTAVSRALRPILAAFVVVSLNAASPEVRGASPGDELAQALRGNVVSIIAEWQNGETHDGFGFIAGERDGQLYIVTANHVVRGALPDEIATTMDIEFYDRQGQKFPGTLLATSDKSHDLAVLRVPLPQGLPWTKDVVSDKGAQRLMSVWFVGRAGRWYVPSTPGTINEIGLDDKIAIDDLNVRVGTSGAPLIADSGIVGMVVSEESGITYAVSIEFIMKAFGYWNHPWQLTARPPTAVVEPPDEVTIIPIEAMYVTIKIANVREEPTVKSAKVTTLKPGAEVYVAGKVEDKNWYLVERDDRTLGYVFGELLLDAEIARQEEEERVRAEAEARQQEERRKARELARQQEEERKRLEVEARQLCDIQLIAPKWNATIDQGERQSDGRIETFTNFMWRDCPEAERYHLYVTHKNARNPIIDNNNIKGAVYQDRSRHYGITALKGWTWKVRPYVDGKWGNWSETRAYNMAPAPSRGAKVSQREYDTVQNLYGGHKKTADCRRIRDLVARIQRFARSTNLVPRDKAYSVLYPTKKPNPTIGDLVADRTQRIRQVKASCF